MLGTIMKNKARYPLGAKGAGGSGKTSHSRMAGVKIMENGHRRKMAQED